MNKLLKILMVVITLSTMVGCGYEVVPQGTKGKILDRGGFQPEVYTPQRVNVGWHGDLVLVETITQTMNEPITVRMKDNMDLLANVRFQLRMGNKDKSLNAVFNDIKPKGNTITLDQVYAVYGKMIVNEVTREVLSGYKIADVQPNFSKISADIYTQVKTEFKPTPLIISDVALGRLNYPEVIDKAILAAARRNLEIEQEKADVAVQMTKIEGQEKVAAGQYRIKMLEAKRIRDYNTMIAKGITPALLKLRELEVQESIIGAIDKGDVATFVVPYGSMNNVGVNNRVFK